MEPGSSRTARCGISISISVGDGTSIGITVGSIRHESITLIKRVQPDGPGVDAIDGRAAGERGGEEGVGRVDVASASSAGCRAARSGVRLEL